MKIAHVTATFPPHFTGTGVVCYHNALGLSRAGHDVTVFTTSSQTGGTDPHEFAVRRLPAAIAIGNAPCTPGLLRMKGFDIIHVHYPYYFGAEMVAIGSLLQRQPYVVTYHQDVLFAGLLRYAPGIHHWLTGRHILARAAKVLPTSLDYARASRLRPLLRTRPWLVDELPNGVDARRFHPRIDGDELRSGHGISREERVVLFVGALDNAHYFKGVHVLLQALALPPAADCRLLVVGDGNRRASHERQAANLGLSERVRFCGRVSSDVLPSYYAACDLLVLPSTTMGEAFGLVLLEAMATGRPVVASNLPGVRSVVSDGEDGLLARPGDKDDLAQKIGMLLDDSQRRRDMGEAGRAKVERDYDWPTIIPRLERVYQEVLARG